MRSDNLRSLGFVGDQIIRPKDGAVEYGDLTAMAVHVEDEILSHDSKADLQNAIGVRFPNLLPIMDSNHSADYLHCLLPATRVVCLGNGEKRDARRREPDFT
jgi:hypothetical protein